MLVVVVVHVFGGLGSNNEILANDARSSFIEGTTKREREQSRLIMGLVYLQPHRTFVGKHKVTVKSSMQIEFVESYEWRGIRPFYRFKKFVELW